MKPYLLFIFLVLFVQVASAQPYSLTDTTFFDKDWKPTTRDNYEYYRTVKPDANAMPPLKLFKAIDYYKNGMVQMDGYVLADDTSKEMGLYRWFKQDGELVQVRLFDYKSSFRHFNLIADYLKKADVCDSANVDLVITFFKRNKVKSISFYRSGLAFDTCKCNRVCIYKEYNPLSKQMFDTWEYQNGKPDGWNKTYFSDGKLWKQILYKNGEKTNIKMKFGSDGKLKKVKGLPESEQQSAASP